MAALETPALNTGWQAAQFRLKSVDGKFYTLNEVKGPKGLVVMFICNHCPYVKAVIERAVRDMRELKTMGVGSVAIMPNDVKAYPDDSYEHMQSFAQQHNFSFPYLIDETQAIAKAYGAVCTPDFFGFNNKLELHYRGRLDESWQLTIPNPERELLIAMKDIAEKGSTHREQKPGIGCSIKWK